MRERGQIPTEYSTERAPEETAEQIADRFAAMLQKRREELLIDRRRQIGRIDWTKNDAAETAAGILVADPDAAYEILDQMPNAASDEECARVLRQIIFHLNRWPFAPVSILTHPVNGSAAAWERVDSQTIPHRSLRGFLKTFSEIRAVSGSTVTSGSVERICDAFVALDESGRLAALPRLADDGEIARALFGREELLRDESLKKMLMRVNPSVLFLNANAWNLNHEERKDVGARFLLASSSAKYLTAFFSFHGYGNHERELMLRECTRRLESGDGLAAISRGENILQAAFREGEQNMPAVLELLDVVASKYLSLAGSLPTVDEADPREKFEKTYEEAASRCSSVNIRDMGALALIATLRSVSDEEASGLWRWFLGDSWRTSLSIGAAHALTRDRFVENEDRLGGIGFAGMRNVFPTGYPNERLSKPQAAVARRMLSSAIRGGNENEAWGLIRVLRDDPIWTEDGVTADEVRQLRTNRVWPFAEIPADDAWWTSVLRNRLMRNLWVPFYGLTDEVKKNGIEILSALHRQTKGMSEVAVRGFAELFSLLNPSYEVAMQILNVQDALWVIAEEANEYDTGGARVPFSERLELALIRSAFNPEWLGAQGAVFQPLQKYLRFFRSDTLPVDGKCSSLWFDNARQRNLVNYLSRVGIPFERCLSAWRASDGSKPEKASFTHLEQLLRLEAARPGSAAKLAAEPFGILAFGRYPIDLLLRQAENADRTDVPWGIVILGEDDHNGALSSPDFAWTDGIGDAQTRVMEAGSLSELLRRFLALREKYGQIHFAYVGGHGTKDSIAFGAPNAVEPWDEHGLASVHLKNLMGLLPAGTFVEGAEGVLNSCSTGGEGRIGDVVSSLFGITVHAPAIPANISKITAELVDGIVRFSVTRVEGENITHAAGAKRKGEG